MIFLVIATYALFRGAAVNVLGEDFPYQCGAFFSDGMAALLAPLGHDRQHVDRDGRTDGPHRRHAGVPADRAALQAPAHRPGPDQRHLQAAARRPRPAAADGAQGRADRLRGSRRGRGVRPRQDRGLHLEGLPRLHHLHRVRSLPVAVPGLEHRQAAVPQARHHEPARPHVREGALPDRGQGDRPKRARSTSREPCDSQHGHARARVRLRTHRGLRPRAGAAPAGRHRRAGRRHRPRRAVVLHQLRCLRRAVPRRHRAHRPHRRYAPLPGAWSNPSSPASSACCSRTWRTRATPGARTPRTAPTGSTRSISTSRSTARTWTPSTASSTCSGSAAPAPTRTAPRRPPRPSPNCWPPPG